MKPEVTDHSGARERIRAVLERRLHSSRLQMTLIVALTGAVGFFASLALLHAGLGSLWLRYPVAVAIAYVAFLFFLWCWLHLRADDFLNGLDLPSPDFGPQSAGVEDVPLGRPFEPGGGGSGGAGASGSFGDSSEGTLFVGQSSSSPSSDGSVVSDAAAAFDLEELTIVVIGIVALVGAAWAALWIVWAAPGFLAELLLDVALASGLYRRLRGIRGGHWMSTAVRRTVWRFAAVAVLFSLAGAAMQVHSPGARSIGQVFHSPKEDH
jgi:hypothetical protein